MGLNHEDTKTRSKYKPYPSYKDSGIEWLGQVPDSWSLKKVNWHMPYVVGWTPSTGKEHYYEGDNLWVTIDDMKKPELSNTKSKISKQAILDKGARIVPKESLLFSFKLSVGKVAFNKRPVYTNEAIASFFDSYEVSTKFLYFAAPIFLPKYGQFNIYGALLMNQELISKAKTFMPSKSEQLLIANFLDQETGKMDLLIEKQQTMIALLKEKRQAIISHAVTKGLNPNAPMKDSGIQWLGQIPEHWSVKRSKFLFEIRKRIAGKLGFSVLSITQKGLKKKDIESGDGQLSMDYSKYQIVNIGDYAMNHMDLLTGYVDIASEKGVTSPDYRVFALIEKKSNPEYYLYLFQNGYKQKIFYAFGQGASHLGRWRLPTNEFNNFVFPYPPEEEQVKIANFINIQTQKSDTLIEKSQQAIALLKERKTALISAAVTGKIDVRGAV